MSKTPPNSVASSGAEPGQVLLGFHAHSCRGLLVHIFERQEKGHGGRIKGPFRILHEGQGKYSNGIKTVIENVSFFGRADDFFAMVNKQPGCRDCTHVLNANALWPLDADLIYDRIINVEDESMAGIRRCSSCGQIYHDLTLNFCLHDGTPLSNEAAEIETIVADRNLRLPALWGERTVELPRRSRSRAQDHGFEYIRAAVAKHPNLELLVHKGSNHRIMKDGVSGSIWIVPRHDGVSITTNGPLAQRLYREMEKRLGKHHRVDAKGYRYFQADDPDDVEAVIKAWASY